MLATLAARLHTAEVRGSRWSRSEVTFGPVGRLVATGLLFLPLAWFVFQAGVFGLVGIAVWSVVLPWGLRDVWRPVPRRETEEESLQRRLREEVRRDAARAERDAEPFEPPARW
jgi:hypothetical protein